MSGNGLNIHVGDFDESKSLERAEQLLEGIEGGYESVVVRAANRAVVSGRAIAAATIRQSYTLKSSEIKKGFKIEKASKNDMTARLTGHGPNLPLSKYRLKPTADTTGANRAQPKVSVKKGGLKPLGHFVYRGNVFVRLGTSNAPIEARSGPNMPALASAVRENIEKRMAESFEDRLEAETRYVLQGGKLLGEK